MADPDPPRDDIERLLADLDHDVQVGAVSLVDYWRRRASIEAGHGDPRRAPAEPPPAQKQVVGERVVVEPPPAPEPAVGEQPVVEPPPAPEQAEPELPALEPLPTPPIRAPEIPVLKTTAPEIPAPNPPPWVSTPLPPGGAAPQISWHELGAAVHGIPGEQTGTPTSASEPPLPEPVPAPATQLVSPAPPDEPATAVGARPKEHQLYAPPEGAVRLSVQTTWEPPDPPNPPRWLARLSTKGDSSARGRSGRRRGWGRKA